MKRSLRSGSEEGSYSRLVDWCITQSPRTTHRSSCSGQGSCEAVPAKRFRGGLVFKAHRLVHRSTSTDHAPITCHQSIPFRTTLGGPCLRVLEPFLGRWSHSWQENIHSLEQFSHRLATKRSKKIGNIDHTGTESSTVSIVSFFVESSTVSIVSFFNLQ